MVNGVPAPIAAHCRLPLAGGGSLEVLTCQFPTVISAGEGQIVVTVNNVASAPLDVTLQPFAPALAEFHAQGGQTLGGFRHVDSGELVTSTAPAVPGEVLAVPANGLGPTDPSVPAGTITPATSPPTVTTPVVEIDGQVVEVLSSTLRLGHVGVYDVTLRLPSSIAPGIHGVDLAIGGLTSNEVGLIVKSPSRGPTITAVVNAGSFDPNGPVAPGSILSLFLTGLTGPSSTNLFPSTSFAGLAVTSNGLPAPLFAVVPEAGRINVLLPTELPEYGEVDVRISTVSGGSAVFPVQLASASPGIFRVADPLHPGRLFAAAGLANTAWIAIPNDVSQALGIPVNCVEHGISPGVQCGHPLRPGETLQLYLTGLGKATPDGNPNLNHLPTGEVAPPAGNPLYRTIYEPDVRIGGLPASVSFSGLTPGLAGVYQINATVPDAVSVGDAVPIQVTMPNGRGDTAVIAIQARE